MTSFAHADYPTQHPGVIRAEQAYQTFREVAANLQNPKGPLAAIVTPVRLAWHALRTQVARHVRAWFLARQDARMWEMAVRDPRLMAEIRRARG
ncbi:MAG: hypothetical protein QM527_10590 [Alphaproteobacteria bacterium]|nr:hypothetical protein [Alphaproteobacteria bacterium]